MKLGVLDFQRTRVCNYSATLLSGAIARIDQFIENVDWSVVLDGITLDDIPQTITELILEAWDKFGVFKYVGRDSLPWFTPSVKFHRREARYWHRQALQ